MSTTLTGLIPIIYTSLDVISRELTGMIPSVTLDASASGAAVGQTVSSFVAPAASVGNITPGATPPDDGNQTIGKVDIVIDKARYAPFRWTGEQAASVGGGAAAQIQAAQIQQAMRALVNEIEADLCALYKYASRAAGAYNATPFGTANDYTHASLTRKILADNGAPLTDLQLVVDTAAGANLRGKQAAAADAGGDSILRQGVLLDINGMAIRESAQIKTHTAGSMSSGSTTGTHAVGATTLALKNATGTGTVAAGDVITIAGDTNQYVVTAASFAGANPATGDTITIAAPGLRVGFTADKVITVVGSCVRNMGFAKSAIILAQRTPYLPGGDAAADEHIATDPRTGLSFRVAAYKEHHRIKYQVECCWGVKLVKPEHTALLLSA